MLKQLLSIILSFFIVLGGVYFSVFNVEDLMEVWGELIAWVIFLVILIFINLDPAPHQDVVQSAKTLPLWQKLKIYWAVIAAGISDLILIILEFLGFGN